MKKLIILIILGFFYSNLANAGLEGSGKITLSEVVVKYFKEYLDTKNHNSTAGSTRHGRGWYFFVAESGEEFGYTYCQQGAECTPNPTTAKNACKKNVKEYLKRKENCYMFAKQRYIVWGGKKIKIKNKASSFEIDTILKEEGFID